MNFERRPIHTLSPLLAGWSRSDATLGRNTGKMGYPSNVGLGLLCNPTHLRNHLPKLLLRTTI